MRNVENNNKGEITKLVNNPSQGVNSEMPSENSVQTPTEKGKHDELLETPTPPEKRLSKKLYLPIIAFVLLILIGFFAFFYFST